jgi:hypothetical protein
MVVAMVFVVVVAYLLYFLTHDNNFVATVWILQPCACAVDAFLAWQIGWPLWPCCLFSSKGKVNVK